MGEGTGAEPFDYRGSRHRRARHRRRSLSRFSGWKNTLKALRPRIIICDESAALRNLTSKRTRTCLELAHYCDKFLALTGTPIQKHPLELYPVLSMIFKGNIMSHVQFRIDGRTSQADRQKAVIAINENPLTRVFVGNILAAGTGLTLTGATHTLFAELSFSPADHMQAERRNLRMKRWKFVRRLPM